MISHPVTVTTFECWAKDHDWLCIETQENKKGNSFQDWLTPQGKSLTVTVDERGMVVTAEATLLKWLTMPIDMDGIM